MRRAPQSTDLADQPLIACHHSPTWGRVELLGFAVERLSYVLSVKTIRRLFRMLPFENLRRLMHISDTLQRRSQEIIDERKEALQKGDEALLAQVGEGRDLMSICREFTYLCRTPMCSSAHLNVLQ